MRTYNRIILVTVVILTTLMVAGLGVTGERYTGPMIDAHGHLGASFDWDMIVKVMGRTNVSRQIVMPRHYRGKGNDRPGTDELALKLADKYPGRFFPLVGMQRPELTGAKKWFKPNRAVEAILNKAERELATGRFYGIGEVIVKHFAYTSGRHAEQENPIYSPFMQRLSLLSARFDVPIVLHMEGAPRLVEDFSRLLRENPRARYVWAHNCGRSKAPVIRAMLAEHPNLYCDLAAMTNVGKRGYGIGWPRMEEYNALIEKNGVLFPEMREVYEAFPDRFMIGMDVAHAPGMNPKNYGSRAKRFRELLGQLSPQTAAAFAESNAIKIYKMDRLLVGRETTDVTTRKNDKLPNVPQDLKSLKDSNGKIIQSRRVNVKSRWSDKVECYKIRYLSDGLEVVGFILKPKANGSKYPAIIFNRGGYRELGKVTNKTLKFLSYFSSKNYVVLASQYRGNDGSQGKEEYGGKDVNDVLNIMELAKSLPFVEATNIAMLGFSRGGMMTCLAMKHNAEIKAAAVVGGITDIEQFYNEREQRIKNMILKLVGSDVAKWQNRSAVYWPEKINVPILILHGKDDLRVNVSQSIKLSEKLTQSGRVHELVVFPKGNHALSTHGRERNKKIIEWFEKYLNF
jgi:dienelactone hydrolase